LEKEADVQGGEKAHHLAKADVARVALDFGYTSLVEANQGA